jgi:hypothetical protein
MFRHQGEIHEAGCVTRIIDDKSANRGALGVDQE